MPDEDAPESPILQETGVDAGNPAQARRAENENELRQRESDQFWNMVFSSAVGRREMWAILAPAHPFAANFGATPTGFPDPNLTFKMLGEQMFGLNLFLVWQQRYPEGTRLMIEENDQRFVKPKARARRKPQQKTPTEGIP